MRVLDKQALTEIERILSASMAPGWKCVSVAAGQGVLDACVTLEDSGGQTAQIAAIFRTRLFPRGVDGLRQTLDENQAAHFLIVSPFLTTGTREALAASGCNYLDLTGNIRLELREPALWISANGAKKNPNAKKERGAATFGSLQGCKIAQGLVELDPPFTVSGFARMVGVPAARVSRLMAPYLAKGYFKRVRKGPITSVDWQVILLDWSRQYELLQGKTYGNYFYSGGIEEFKKKLALTTDRYAVTGTEACSEIAPFSPPWTMMVYAEDIEAFAKRFELRPAEGFSTVMLIEAKDDGVFRGCWKRQGVQYVSISRLVVDLLAGPGRMSSEGDNLLRWMGVDESAWRPEMCMSAIGEGEQNDGVAITGRLQDG